jgi:two-component system response regulator FixJ
MALCRRPRRQGGRRLMGVAMIGAAAATPLVEAAEVQTTIVTQDREWAATLARELRDHQLPTLTPIVPTRWREHFDEDRANCVVFDLDHSSDHVFDAIAQLRSRADHVMVVAAASSPSIKLVVDAIKAGAMDFVNKRQPLRMAVEQVLDAAAQARAQENVAVESSEHRARIVSLTPREHEVLRQLAAGLATKQIAHSLDLSPRTVEMFRRRIRARLGASSIAEAVSIWMSHRAEPRLRVVG